MGTDDQQKRLVDELEIRNVLARLAQGADDGDLNEYVRLFAEDGSWQAPDGSIREGRSDLLAGAQARRAGGIQGPGTNTFHVVTNTVVNLDGDQATSTSYYQFYGNTDATPEIRRTGIYRDEFRRTADGWKMQKRVIQGPPI